MRTTFIQVKTSRIPSALGICASDNPTLASYVNEAQMRLIEAGGNEGWWGTYAKMVFDISHVNPFITIPRHVARIINLDVCRVPIRIQNEFYEFLEFGCGLQRQPPSCSSIRCGCDEQVYDRGTVPFLRDFTPGNKLRFYLVNQADTLRRVFVQGTDNNDMPIFTEDNGVTVNGVFITLDNLFPFVESPMAFNTITGMQKDVTVGPVKIYGVNTITDQQTLLSMMEPSEQNACYRKYFVGDIVQQCGECDSPTDTVQITAMVKLEFIPVLADTDYLLIGNIPALKEECQAIRFGEMDTAAAMNLAPVKHREAIRLLNKELIHYLGKERPAFSIAPFGRDTMESVNAGMI